ncbi:MAG: hypothetical protein ACRCZQ_07965 [Bacteroidales bacterium]
MIWGSLYKIKILKQLQEAILEFFHAEGFSHFLMNLNFLLEVNSGLLTRKENSKAQKRIKGCMIWGSLYKIKILKQLLNNINHLLGHFGFIALSITKFINKYGCC